MADLKYNSRRPVILSQNGAVACADPRAAQIAVDILRQGGNAADAAVAVAAALNVTNPMSTGLGGDAFCLFYDATSKTVKGLNGSGHASNGISLEMVLRDGYSPERPLPENHGYTVTVPGAAAAWVDTVHMFGSGKLSLSELLEPAIALAEEGHPVTQIAAHFWNKGAYLLKDIRNSYGTDMLMDGRAPMWGEVFKNQHLANTMKALAKNGKKGFYEGPIAEAIVDAVRAFGGTMTLEDLRNHESSPEDPISVEYKGVRLWEIPPNGQGIVALMVLNILRGFNIKGLGHNSSEYLHTVIEAVRLGFSDALAYVADPRKVHVPIQHMLSTSYGDERRKLIQADRAIPHPECGDMSLGSDTVYFTVVDKLGNACSFINSNYMGFGSGIVPKGCGFTLQNRGCNFSLKEGHPNVIAQGKRPYHTIIPAMLTKDATGELLCSYGVMGGFMQPQGHVQVLLNMLEFGMNPQEALDQPRFCVGPGHEGPIGSISIEEGISKRVIEELRAKGHDIVGPVIGHNRSIFGRGHVITRGAWWKQEGDPIHNDKGTLWAGSDPRADGMALGY